MKIGMDKEPEAVIPEVVDPGGHKQTPPPEAAQAEMPEIDWNAILMAHAPNIMRGVRHYFVASERKDARNQFHETIRFIGVCCILLAVVGLAFVALWKGLEAYSEKIVIGLLGFLGGYLARRGGGSPDK